MAYCPKCDAPYPIVTSTTGSSYTVPVTTEKYNSKGKYIGYEESETTEFYTITLPRCSNCYSVLEFPNATSKKEFFYALKDRLENAWRGIAHDKELEALQSLTYSGENYEKLINLRELESDYRRVKPDVRYGGPLFIMALAILMFVGVLYEYSTGRESGQDLLFPLILSIGLFCGGCVWMSKGEEAAERVKEEFKERAKKVLWEASRRRESKGIAEAGYTYRCECGKFLSSTVKACSQCGRENPHLSPPSSKVTGQKGVHELPPLVVGSVLHRSEEVAGQERDLICNQCKGTVPPGSKFCPCCGSSVP